MFTYALKILQKKSYAILVPLFCLCLTFLDAALDVQIDSSYGVLIDSQNGHVLFNKKMDTLIYPASTTKLATALFVLSQAHNLEEKVVATKDVLKKVSRKYKDEHLKELPAYILQTDGTSFGIVDGEELSILSLLYGLLISSGNDAANVLAFHFGKGSIPCFMEEMNLYLRQLGLKKSHFCNPHGLHDGAQISTPYEMAKIARLCLQNPVIADIVATKEYMRPKTNKQEERKIEQPNRLIANGRLYFEEAVGMKTGYTANAGYCLIAAASNGNRSLIAALFNAKESSSRYRDAIVLFSEAFEEMKVLRPLFIASESYFCSKDRLLKASLQDDVSIMVYPSEEALIESQAIFNPMTKPIAIGDQVGVLAVYKGEEKIGSYPLFAKEPFLSKKESKWDVFLYIAIGLIFLCLGVCSYIFLRSGKEKARC